MSVLNCHFTFGSYISLQPVGLVKPAEPSQQQQSEQPQLLVPCSSLNTAGMLSLHPEAGEHSQTLSPRHSHSFQVTLQTE